MPNPQALDGAGAITPTAEQEARQRTAHAYRQSIIHDDLYFAALLADYALYGGLQGFADSLSPAHHAVLAADWDRVRAIGALQDPPVALPANLPAQTP